jgi:DNA-directed RNA polymerase specialized sigma24 family protein
MATGKSVTRWAAQLRDSERSVREEAAREIWKSYATKLAAVARRKLPGYLKRRVGVSDVLQDAYFEFCEFCRHASELKSRDDVCGLLLCITLRKVFNAIDHHGADRRNARLEEHAGKDELFPQWVLHEMSRREPGPDEVAAFNEALEQLLGMLPLELRKIVQWKREGDTNGQIAEKLGLTERSVEMKCRRIRCKWQRYEAGTLEKRRND